MRTRKAITTTLAIAAAAAFTFALAGCNAVSGAGKDLQEASDNTSEAIDKAVND